MTISNAYGIYSKLKIDSWMEIQINFLIYYFKGRKKIFAYLVNALGWTMEPHSIRCITCVIVNWCQQMLWGFRKDTYLKYSTPNFRLGYIYIFFFYSFYCFGIKTCSEQTLTLYFLCVCVCRFVIPYSMLLNSTYVLKNCWLLFAMFVIRILIYSFINSQNKTILFCVSFFFFLSSNFSFLLQYYLYGFECLLVLYNHFVCI